MPLRVNRAFWTAACLAALIAVLAFGIFGRRPAGNPVVHFGTAAVGGRIDLMSHNGVRFTDVDLAGRPRVIYFGWTGDPDLTPAALQVMADALARLGTGASRVAALFITLDPERDRPDRLRTFVAGFHPGLVGLTGKPDEIAATAGEFKIYFRRIADPSLPGGYSIEHASLYYVLGKDGAFAAAVPYTTDSKELADEIRKQLN